MKIAILTRRAGFNMGSSLQAYAMYKMLSKLGHQVEILNYDEYAHFFLWRVKPFLNRIWFKIANLCPLLCGKNKYVSLQRIFKQQQQFKNFESLYMPLTRKVYKSSKDLALTNGSYDAYVCGSDQIWSPLMFDPAYYLDFVCQKKSRAIAYAPSLGVVDSRFVSDKAKELINEIPFVSCREKDGAKVLSEITGRNIPVVLDPTLMLEFEDWNALVPAEPVVKGEYILTYFLHTQFFEDNIPNEFIQQLKSDTGLNIVNIQMHNMLKVVKADTHLYECGPIEFLSLIKNAAFVVTNSFHCCVFSFIFKRNFFVFERFRKNNVSSNQNPRIYSLLETIDSECSLVKDRDNYILDEAKNKDLTLYKLRKMQSFEFLKSALMEGKSYE